MSLPHGGEGFQADVRPADGPLVLLFDEEGAAPKHAKTYQANAQAYKERLSALHNRALGEFEKLSADRRTVVTAHDAFGYLADAYGLTFLAPVGIDTDAEPSANDLATLIGRP